MDNKGKKKGSDFIICEYGNCAESAEPVKISIPNYDSHIKKVHPAMYSKIIQSRRDDAKPEWYKLLEHESENKKNAYVVLEVSGTEQGLKLTMHSIGCNNNDILAMGYLKQFLAIKGW